MKAIISKVLLVSEEIDGNYRNSTLFQEVIQHLPELGLYKLGSSATRIITEKAKAQQQRRKVWQQVPWEARRI